LRNATAWVIPIISFVEGGRVEKCNSLGYTICIVLWGLERLRMATAWVIPNVSFVEGGKVEKGNSMGYTICIVLWGWKGYVYLQQALI